MTISLRRASYACVRACGGKSQLSSRVHGSFEFIPVVRKQCVEGRVNDALQTVDFMYGHRVSVPTNIFYELLQACIKAKNLTVGRDVYKRILRSHLELNSFLGSHLIRLFAVCGCLQDANDIFGRLPEPCLFAWSAIISANAKFGNAEQAIKLYRQMQHRNVEPGHYVFVAVLTACSSLEALHHGRQIHAHIIEIGYELDIYAGNTLIDMYCKCGSLEDAKRMHSNGREQDVVTWSALIGGYVQCGRGHEALCLFYQMQYEGIQPNNITSVFILQACSCIAALDQGKRLHIYITTGGCSIDVFVNSALIDMYVKCGSVKDARTVFNETSERTVVTWSAMISGYAHHGYSKEALLLYDRMQQEGLKANTVTYNSILMACSRMVASDQGKVMHHHIMESGLAWDVSLGNTLIDMYAKAGSLFAAHTVFNSLHDRDQVTWNALIMAYAQCGQGKEALRLVQQMQQEGMDLDNITFISLLKACSSILTLDLGKLIHVLIVESSCETHMSVGSSLVDMYVKCDSLEDACRVFYKLSKRDVVAWGAMITGYAQYSNLKLALQYFHNMQLEGLKPNAVIFLCLLSACSRVGLMTEGCNLFISMLEDYDISPSVEHYNCLVDLFARVGQLNEAEDLLKTMPAGSSIMGWTSLLNHSRLHGNRELGRRCFGQFGAVDMKLASEFELMSKIYSDISMLDNVDEIHKVRKREPAWKKPGKAFIEVANKIHDFIVEDKSHSQTVKIYAKLSALSVQLRQEGFVPDLNNGLQLVF